jgi:hypothetical protein
MKIEFYRQVFEKRSNTKFQQHPSSEIRVLLCGRTGRQTDMTKLIVVFRNYANSPKKTFINEMKFHHNTYSKQPIEGYRILPTFVGSNMNNL